MLCSWRVSKAEPSGLQVWFDPETEVVKLYALEPHAMRGVLEFGEGDDLRTGPNDQMEPQVVLRLDEGLPF